MVDTAHAAAWVGIAGKGSDMVVLIDIHWDDKMVMRVYDN